jgi:hypothetical protein
MTRSLESFIARAHFCNADFLDVHIYPENTGSQAGFLSDDLGSVEWPVVQGDLPKTAVLMGEFGAFEGTFKDVTLAGAVFLYSIPPFVNGTKTPSCPAVRSMEIQVSAAATHNRWVL